MKITDIKTYAIRVGHRNQLIVKVETDEGIVGWGEAGLSSREHAVMAAIGHFREWLIGRDPMRTGALWQELYRSQYFEGGRVLTGAMAALDIAFYDITGKALGVPVYQLLGGKQRDWIALLCHDQSGDGAGTDRAGQAAGGSRLARCAHRLSSRSPCGR